GLVSLALHCGKLCCAVLCCAGHRIHSLSSFFASKAGEYEQKRRRYKSNNNVFFRRCKVKNLQTAALCFR
ncbi:MAG: hypothetical protein SOZ52_02625, partial [Pyramidobacter sp.]|nr:hypothetical protein [Pyramidobacter sp.]